MSEVEGTINKGLRGRDFSSDSGSAGGGSEDNFFIGMSSFPHSSSDKTLAATAVENEVAVAGQKRQNNGKQKEVGGESDHEVHIWTERERRKKMRSMFSNLHAMIPQLPSKADKSTIVDEAVKYIKILQNTVQTLQRQKLERLRNAGMGDFSMIATPVQPLESREAFLANQGPSKLPSSFSVPLYPASFQTWFSPNVVMNMCGDDAQISVCSAKKPGLLTTIFHILQKHNLDVVSAHVSSDQHRCLYMIHAHGGGACDQLPEALTLEEKFKLAVGEINMWLTSY